MTPKWAFQRRVDGILRFAMSPTIPKGQSDPAHRCSPANAVRRIRYVDVASTSTMAASKELRIRAIVSPPPRWLGIAARLWALWRAPPSKPGASYLPVSSSCCLLLMHERRHRGGMADPWLANHVEQRTPAFFLSIANPCCGGSSPPAPWARPQGKVKYATWARMLSFLLLLFAMVSDRGNDNLEP
ncbi:hypothetical protein GGI42DRAFT_203553 [Trichoderma sp. SZMC 28013]